MFIVTKVVVSRTCSYSASTKKISRNFVCLWHIWFGLC